MHNADRSGELAIMARAKNAAGELQPLTADWNVLGYGNNGVEEHSVRVNVE